MNQKKFFPLMKKNFLVLVAILLGFIAIYWVLTLPIQLNVGSKFTLYQNLNFDIMYNKIVYILLSLCCIALLASGAIKILMRNIS